MKKILSLALSSTCLFASAQSTDNMKLVDSSSSFNTLTTPITRGMLLKTTNLHFYEITDKVNQKPTPAQPVIKVYQDGKKYKISIQGIDKLLACKKVQDVIESKIDGYFKGWDGTTTFALMNGQKWKQDEPTGTVFANLYQPNVLIYLGSDGYRMKVDGLNEDPILVKKQ
jgi:hypothetical protein